MQAHEIMITHVYKVKETDTVRSVIEKFIEHGISGLPVVNDRNEIVGYISDGDIMRYIGKNTDIVIDSFYYINVIKGEEFEERARKILDLNVMEISKTRVIKVAWNEEIDKIAAILGKRKIKKLPVERNGVLVGIISRGDVIRNTFKSIL
ncbi:CBS domain-containing protein [Bacillus sp. FJAT-49736]|uniref:CBS domain-containing protein n=1 Tax=Bacillus sp. FJAT-49736 TaxID=2833582 RepID=UPI001BCA5B2C|nr:CBS domain-containing protein [Bacillus sp. FJAT-49736]MBS4175281.1 CBS domain-containing protein [Bacillus sp. FJAT-49736]